MKFLQNTPRFSFLYGGKPYTECAYEKAQEITGNTVITTYLFDGGLKFTNVAKKYDTFGAYEWVNYLENVGTQNTPVLSELWDCDCELPCSHREVFPSSPYTPDRSEMTYVLNPNGSTTVDEYDFYTHVDDSCHRKSFLFPMKSPRKRYSSIGGRSSDGNAPFFNIHDNGRGYFVGVGWTGQWNCQLQRTTDSVRVQSKIEDTHFYLMPGEKIRTSSVIILPYEGSIEDSFNLWRRFLRQELSPIAGRMEALPLSLGFWGGTESKELLHRMDYALGECQIPFDCVWMDAGWCGFNTASTPNEFSGDWAQHVGDWTISPLIHQNGLCDVAAQVKKYGKKYVLWFEPERVWHTVPIVREHPEYLLTSGKANEKNHLLNLGNLEAWQYCADILCDIVGHLQVDVYRQDFNFPPLPFWRHNDTPDRQGITEIKHIMGLYRLWDLLLERFPTLIIDNCASGGKRLDVETLRRSVPLWRSDAQCPANPIPEITQANHMNFSLWMPYSGTGSGRMYDTYRMRSAYAPALSTTYSYSSDEHFGENADEVAWLKARAEEYLRVRPYFDGDVYHLTPPTRDDMSWCGVQWHRPEKNDGLLQIFKRERCLYPEAVFPLRKLDTQKTYRFTDADGGSFEISGRELAENGFRLRIEENRVAKLYFYEVVR